MRLPDYNQLLKRVPRLASAGRGLLAGSHRLRARLGAWAKTGPPARPGDAEAWSRRLLEEKDSLLALVRGMEAEFLTTSDGLESLACQLGEIQKACQSLTDLTLGKTQDAAVQFAFQLLKKAEDLVLASYEQYDHVFAAFSELQERLAQVSKQRDELMHILLPLNFITMAFRIEASRHPVEVQQAFFTLSDSMNRTVSEVRATMERQFNDLAVSEQIARRLMEQISISIQQYRQNVTSTLAGTRAQLGALSEDLISSGAGATDLTQRNQAVTGHINGIVMALQCQDMASQRIVHVGEAMDEMRGYLGGGRPVNPGTDSETRRFIFRAGQIQLQQIQSVFDQLHHTAADLKSGIGSLRTEAGAAAELAVKVGGTTLDAKVASQCQRGIGEILGIVRQAVQRIAEVIAAFDPLQASFVDCTGKATVLAGDIRLAGLNAQVFAIRTPDGATLEVLAERVHAIAQEVIQQAEQMGTLLGHTSDMVTNLRQRLDDFQTLGAAEQAILADESALSMKKLADLEGAIPVRIQGVTQRQKMFVESAEKVLANIQFPETVAQASSRSVGFFQDLLAWAGVGGAGGLDETAASEKLDELKSKYTMESERHAHAAALAPGLAPASPVVPECSIELFDDFAAAAPAIADSSAAIPHPGEQAKEPMHPAEATAMENSLSAPVLPMEGKKPATSGNLGDNVELF